MTDRRMTMRTSEVRRLVVAAIVGVVVALITSWFVKVELALLSGWDATALMFLVAVWPTIILADSADAKELATRTT